LLGKTHVISSLAVMHVGLLAYTAYENRSGDVQIMLHSPDTTLELFGFPFGVPLSLAEYSLIVTVISLFILGLLRVGRGFMLAGHFGIVALCMATLMFGFDSTHPFKLALVLLAFTLGTVLPDIDSENSTIGKYITPISRAIPHRTITHTIWVVLLILGLAWYFESIYLLALALGYVVHITEDSFSQQGIRWFYPIPKIARKRWRFPFAYETGGLGETVVFFASIGIHVLCAGFVVWSNMGVVG
jgi:membrane-bound metal-dependent hydrolase YbcI (DUF457 family)